MSLKTPRRPIELEIDSWFVEESGFTESPYIARFELVWPRPGIDSVKRVLPFPNDFGQEIDWSNEELLKKWLFKEDMEGRTVLTVSILPVQSEDSGALLSDDVLDVIGRSISQTSSIAWGTLSDLMDLGEDVAKYLLAGPQKTIAKGSRLIDKQEDQLLNIPLRAPNTLRNPKPDPTPEDHRPKDDHQEILKEKGDKNGFIKIKMSVWED